LYLFRGLNSYMMRNAMWQLKADVCTLFLLVSLTIAASILPKPSAASPVAAAADTFNHRVLLNASTNGTSPHVVHLKAVLSGSQVAPKAGGPVRTTATGEATATLIGNILMIHGTYNGISLPLRDLESKGIGNPGFHLHPGGYNADIPYLFGYPIITQPPTDSASLLKDAANKPNGQFRGWNMVDATLLKLLLSGNTYVDIHTKKHPDGEIRGQLLVVDHVDKAQSNPKGRR
jgi:hypothetical protein